MAWVGGALIFYAEMSLLVALAWWPVASLGGPLGWALAVALPLTLAVVWGRNLSPRARAPLRPVPSAIVRTCLLAAGTLLYADLGAGVAMVLHTGAWVVGTPVALRWPLEPKPSRE